MCVVQKNDSEKELLKLQRVHQQQQEDLQRLAKRATLEATVKQQEKVNSNAKFTLTGIPYLISQQGVLLSMSNSLKCIC